MRLIAFKDEGSYQKSEEKDGKDKKKGPGSQRELLSNML